MKLSGMFSIVELIFRMVAKLNSFICHLLAVKKPCLHLQDIREIKPEELTYSFPAKPLLKCSHSELYKGMYNKFTVAIKRYSCPLNTNPSPR